MFVEYCFSPICDTQIMSVDDVAKFLSYLYSGFSCYATQSSNPFRQASLLIDIKTHETMPEFIGDVLGRVGHSRTLLSHVHVAVTVQRPFPGLLVVLKLYRVKIIVIGW